MRLEILVYLILIVINVLGEGCSKVKCEPAPKHYEEFGCTPVVEEGKFCPTYYDCSTFKKRDATKCHFKNETIDVGERLNRTEIGSTCTAACLCKKPFAGKTSPTFVCARIDCPPSSFFRPIKPEDEKPEKCISQFEANMCCSTASVCGEDLNKLSTCDVDGKTYYEGEKIDTKQSCHTCICGKGYEDKPFAENKHCKPVSCNLDLHFGSRIEKDCIPIYYKTDECCPIGWRCPNNETTIITDPTRNTTIDNPNLKCTFGKLVMDVGDSLSSNDGDEKCTTCSCKTPPFAHCINMC